MPEIHIDSLMTDAERLEKLYDGALFVYQPTETTLAFCEFASELIKDAFQGIDPETAQYELPVEQYVDILKELKPRFIHHPESKKYLHQILMERGCDLQDTYFDVPRMRSSTSDGYLTSGIAYAWHPHRDTWYSAPLTQINWWTPIYPITADNGMATYLDKFHQVVPNDSAKYDYEEWNEKHRFTAAGQIKKDDRPLPRPTVPIDAGNGITLVTKVGGLVLFSGHQLHSSIENNSGKTRFSIDFRTISLNDTVAKKGAPNPDVACTGSSVRDFIRAGDLAKIPDDIATALEDRK